MGEQLPLSHPGAGDCGGLQAEPGSGDRAGTGKVLLGSMEGLL